jgi:hypothetical protein
MIRSRWAIWHFLRQSSRHRTAVLLSGFGDGIDDLSRGEYHVATMTAALPGYRSSSARMRSWARSRSATNVTAENHRQVHSFAATRP